MKAATFAACLVTMLVGAGAMTFANCPFSMGQSSFCCSNADCQKMLGSNQYFCNSQYQCQKCGSDSKAEPCPGAPVVPSYTAPPTYTQRPTYAPTYAPCSVRPVGGFCCSDADCKAQTGQKFVYCNTRFNQCNACGLYKTPKCPGGQTPVDGACPYSGYNNDGTFCCEDTDCRKALNQTYVYCNKNSFQCNACGLPGTPACPSTLPPLYGGPSVPGYGTPAPSYYYPGCSETTKQCCSDLTCQRKINNPYVFCNTTYYQCNACGNMANQVCCPGSVCRSGFTCTQNVCIQTGYVPPAGAVVGIVVGCAVAAVAVIAGVVAAVRRRRLAVAERAPSSSNMN